jgi:putative membrane protein
MSPDLRAFLASWEWDPTVLIGLVLAAWLYARGWRRLRRRGRGGRWLKPWRAWCYYIGLGFLFFTMHMIEHLLLIMFAAPFIWLGAPLLPVLWAFPREGRRRIGRIFRRSHPVHRVFRWLTSAPVALTIYVVTLVVWHFPGPYDAAQGRTVVHDFEHITFLIAALIFWWPVIHPTGGKRRLSYGMAILYLFPAKIAGFVIGAALTLTSQVVYSTYTHVPRLWGLSALEDQQLGGLIMWVFGGFIFVVPILFLVTEWMKEDEGDIWTPGLTREQARLARQAAAKPEG